MTEKLRKMHEILKWLERDLGPTSSGAYEKVRVLQGLLQEVEERYQSLAVALFEKGVVPHG